MRVKYETTLSTRILVEATVYLKAGKVELRSVQLYGDELQKPINILEQLEPIDQDLLRDEVLTETERKQDERRQKREAKRQRVIASSGAAAAADAAVKGTR